MNTAIEIPPRHAATLYELATDCADLVAVIEMLDYEEHAEALDVLIAQLDEIDAPLAHKAENVCRFLRNLEARTTAIKAERHRLADREIIAANKARRIKDYLKLCLETAYLKKLSAGIFEISVRSNPQAVDRERIEREVDTPAPMTIVETSIPGVSWEYRPVLVIDSKALPGEYRLPRGTHVRVS